MNEAQAQLLHAWDDVTGSELDHRMVIKFREKDMGYIRQKPVWQQVPRSLAKRQGWKIIQTRWIDINKGDIAG